MCSSHPFPSPINTPPQRWISFVCSLVRSEVGALSRLRQLLVGGRGHVPADLDQHGLHGEVALPGCYAGELGEVDLRGRKTVVLVRSPFKTFFLVLRVWMDGPLFSTSLSLG
jgi:hypothetical protein